MDRYDLFVMLVVAFAWIVIYSLLAEMRKGFREIESDKNKSEMSELISEKDSIINNQKRLIDYQNRIIYEKDKR
jgi:hypothetical protein